MNNENSPFESRSETPLDRAIDRAVRQMMEVDPPADLRSRVLASLDAPTPGRWAFFPRFAAAAAVLAMLVVAVVFVPRPPQAPAVVAEPPARMAPAPPSTGQPLVPSPDAADGPKARSRAGARPPALHREPIVMPKISNVFGSTGSRVSAANAPESAKAADLTASAAAAPQAIVIPALPVTRQQKPEERAAAEARATTAPPAGEATRANVNIELTFTEHGGPAGPVQKTVSMLVSDRHNGSIRSRGVSPAPVGGAAAQGVEQRSIGTLNVDARPSVYPDDSILVSLTIEYEPGPTAPRGGQGTGWLFELRESMSLLLTSGRPILISQSADPSSNRRITVELKATVLR